MIKPTKVHLSEVRSIAKEVSTTARDAEHMNYAVEDLISDLQGQAESINNLINELEEYERQIIDDENPETLKSALSTWKQLTERQQHIFRDAISCEKK